MRRGGMGMEFWEWIDSVKPISCDMCLTICTLSSLHGGMGLHTVTRPWTGGRTWSSWRPRWALPSRALTTLWASTCPAAASCLSRPPPTSYWSCPTCTAWRLGHWTWARRGSFPPRPTSNWAAPSPRWQQLYLCSPKLALVLESVLFRILETVVLPSEPVHVSTCCEQNLCNQGYFINKGRSTNIEAA